MEHKYVELSFTLPASVAVEALATQELVERGATTLFSDEGGLVAGVSLEDTATIDDGHALVRATNLAITWIRAMAPSAEQIPLPWSMKVVDRERMADYFHLVATQPPLPACGQSDDDGLAGVGA